jgi:hypothetical protein
MSGNIKRWASLVLWPFPNLKTWVAALGGFTAGAFVAFLFVIFGFVSLHCGG